MQNILPYIIFAVVILTSISPVYFQNRRIRRLVDEDLKKLNPEDWEIQHRYSLKATLIAQLVGGIAILGSIVYVKTRAAEFSMASGDFVLMFAAAALIVFGLWRYRAGIAKIDGLLRSE